MRLDNPFTPTFGKIPAILAGRDGIILEMTQAFTSNGGDPNLCSLFSGPRGVGKTVLLSHLANQAGSMGWISANVTARPGVLEDIIERASEAADSFVERESSRRLTSISVPTLFGASWEYRKPESGNWRTRMNRLLDTLAQHDIGLLITIDEIDPHLEELIDFAATYQHFVREDRKVALLLAGLPAHISTLLSDKSVSFLRRAAQHQVGEISDHDVREAFRQTIEEGGKRASDEVLDAMVEAADGFAYMIQLVGFRSWSTSAAREEISLDDAKTGIELARADFINGVVKKTCQELSDGDISFLEAMLPDNGKPSEMSAIAERMGKSPSYARVYRARLVEAGVIDAPMRGKVVFNMPMLRGYLMDEL